MERRRPGVVTVFGVLNIVFGALGLIGICCSLPAILGAHAGGGPVARVMGHAPVYRIWAIFSIATGFLAAPALIAAGIGLLAMKSWGRVVTIIYSIYAIAFGLIGTLMNLIFLVPPLLRMAERHHGPEAAGAVGGAIGGTVGGCLALAYPIVALIFMLRPRVAAALRPPVRNEEIVTRDGDY